MKSLTLPAILFSLMANIAHAQALPPSAIVTWSDASNNEDGFGVERKLGTTGTYAEIGRVGANVATYNDANLAYSVMYCYRVYAFNVAGKSVYSPEGCGTTKDDPLPKAPGAVTVKPQ